MTAFTIVLGVSWIAAALLAGGLAAVSVGNVRAGRTLDGPTWSTVHRALDRTLGPYFRVVIVVAIASTAAAAVIAPYGVATLTRVAVGGAAALFAAVLAISVAVNVPINRAVAAWSDPPADWEARRARWNRFQDLRALAAAAAVIAMTVGVFGAG